jgi:hypothetical protein
MKGLLVHKTFDKNILNILEKGKLYSKKSLEKNLEKSQEDLLYGWGGPSEIDLLFFQLIFEDKPMYFKNISNQSSRYYIPIALIFNDKLIRDYGLKIFDDNIHFFKNEYPNSKVWFNTEWNFGEFKANSNKHFSTDYSPELSLEDNVELFNFAQQISMMDKKNNYEKSKYFQNELVILEKELDLSKYLLGIFIWNERLRLDMKQKYPKYNILDVKELDSLIKDYFED